jgi:hypothetical protein
MVGSNAVYTHIRHGDMSRDGNASIDIEWRDLGRSLYIFSICLTCLAGIEKPNLCWFMIAISHRARYLRQHFGKQQN